MRVQQLLKRTLGFFALLAAMTPGASAGLITYIGTDLGADMGGPWPNSNAAAASFDAASGPETVITFESTCRLPSWLPCYQFGGLPPTKFMIAPGVFINGLNDNTPNPGHQQIAFPGISGQYDGYNTTPGGGYYILLAGGFLTFTFDTPIDRFGAYISGVNNDDTITFDDGSPQKINIPNPWGPGFNSFGPVSLSFVGFTDFGRSIHSLTVNAYRVSGGVVYGEFIGIDDVRVPVAVPEPSAPLLLVAVLAAIATLRQASGQTRRP